MDLAVELHGSIESLEDALDQFTSAELLDGENEYK
jgi:ubiquitin carboxyl-terminal hydrolase 36/42